MTDAMSTHETCTCHPKDRARIELIAFARCLMPRPTDQQEAMKKAVTLVLVVGWLLWSYGLGHGTIERGNTVLWGFTVYELFSIVVVYMFARLHDLEVKRELQELVTGSRSNTPRDDGDDDR